MNGRQSDRKELKCDTAGSAVDLDASGNNVDGQTADREVKLRSKPRTGKQRGGLDTQVMAIVPATLALLLAAFQLIYVQSIETVPFWEAPFSREFQMSDWLYLAIFGLTLSSYLTYRRIKKLGRSQIGQTKEELAKRLEALEDKSWEIRESEEIHRSLAEAFGDVVLHRNHEGVINFQNKHFEKYFDQGFPLPKLLGGLDVQTPELQTRDIEIETRLGKRWFAWADLAVRDPDSGQTGIRSIARDITDRKVNERALEAALEQAETASESKSRFLAMVSHEIRTPLNGAIGMAKLLEDTKLDATQKSYVDAITKSGRSLLGLIEDLLDTARIEAGQMVLQPRPTDLRCLVEDIADILGPRAREKKVDLATFVDPHIPNPIEFDPDRLRQVLLNLVGNAVKFTENGGVAIFVEQHGNNIEFCVSDTGPGLSAEDQEKIFEDFAQSSTGATRAHEGAGLGLAISRNLVRLMGAEISVDSILGSGSKFRFSIPVQEVADSRPLPSPGSKGKMLVLMAETPASLALMKILDIQGYSAQICTSQDQFGALLKSSEWNAIVADRCLLTVDFEDKITAPLYLLGDAGEGSATGNQSNIDGWLTWPVRAQTLLTVLNGEMTKSEERVNSGETKAKTQPTLKILLAEDNPINAMLVNTLLSKLGHDVTHVENGRMAVNEYRRSVGPIKDSYDLVLMDLHMPELDGSEAISLLRTMESEKNLSPVKIIVLSADGQQEVRDIALSNGADEFLIKPLDLDAVANLLSEHDSVSGRVLSN